MIAPPARHHDRDEDSAHCSSNPVAKLHLEFRAMFLVKVHELVIQCSSSVYSTAVCTFSATPTEERGIRSAPARCRAGEETQLTTTTARHTTRTPYPFGGWLWTTLRKRWKKHSTVWTTQQREAS